MRTIIIYENRTRTGTGTILVVLLVAARAFVVIVVAVAVAVAGPICAIAHYFVRSSSYVPRDTDIKLYIYQQQQLDARVHGSRTGNPYSLLLGRRSIFDRRVGTKGTQEGANLHTGEVLLSRRYSRLCLQLNRRLPVFLAAR